MIEQCNKKLVIEKHSFLSLQYILTLALNFVDK